MNLFSGSTGLPVAHILPEPAACGILDALRAELAASAIAPDVAALNVAAFGPGTDRHWELERAELVAHKRREVATESRTASGHPQAQPGHLSAALQVVDRRYRFLSAGGWRTLSDTLPGLPTFDQWKPATPRGKQARDRSGQWVPVRDRRGRPVPVKYEAPPSFPDGAGLLLPRVPLRCWLAICDRHGLPHPTPATIAAGFWPWVLATPALPLLVCEGWKKALAAVSAGWAAVALPGVTMGYRRPDGGTARLIAALGALNGNGRRWLIAFDAEARTATARKVSAAAGALARTLRAAGGRPLVARLPLLPGADKTGLDDLLAAAGPEALDRALATTSPAPVLPYLRPADRIAPAGRWLADACPLPPPEVAPLVVVQAPMGCGKTHAIAAAVAPLAAAGVPLLLPSHRKALGQAAAEQIGVPWCPRPGSDDRQQGIAGCWDSWCPTGSLRVSPDGWSGGVMVLDEWAQACEHLLLSAGTALGKRRRAVVLRTASEQLARLQQVIAADAQLPDWAVRLLEQLTGRRALVIRSEHQPMQGRTLYCPDGLTNPTDAADAFRAQWAELVDTGRTFLCWTSAQQHRFKNSPHVLATLHRQRVPGARVLVIDSTTPELAAELAADPDGVAARFDAIYCSPSISSGISFERWRPDAVIAYSGGHIAPEHAAQALARVRCPQVPAYLFAPERCPGGALRVGSGSTDPAQLIAHLRAVTDPLLGVLREAGDPWLQAWAELGAHRNRQLFAYRSTIAGLLEAEGWQLHSPTAPTTAPPTAELGAITDAAIAQADAAIIAAPVLTDPQAQALNRRRKRTPDEQAAYDRWRVDRTWALGGADPTPDLLAAHRDGCHKGARIGWLLTTPEALALVPQHDRRQTDALDPEGRPFRPDELRVALGPLVNALRAIGLPELLQRFAAGETIAATDPAVLALHTTATAHRHQLTAATSYSPAKLPTGTLRALLQALGWKLTRAGRVNTRGAGRGALTYRAAPALLPAGVDRQALEAAWLADLRGGAHYAPMEKPIGAKIEPPSPWHQPAPGRRDARTAWVCPAVSLPVTCRDSWGSRGSRGGWGDPHADPLL